MRVVKAIYDGSKIKPTDPIGTKKKSEVLIIFPDDENKIAPDEARKMLRGSAKGEKLVKKLLESRKEDLKLGF